MLGCRTRECDYKAFASSASRPDSGHESVPNKLTECHVVIWGGFYAEFTLVARISIPLKLTKDIWQLAEHILRLNKTGSKDIDYWGPPGGTQSHRFFSFPRIRALKGKWRFLRKSAQKWVISRIHSLFYFHFLCVPVCPCVCVCVCGCWSWLTFPFPHFCIFIFVFRCSFRFSDVVF